MFAKSLKIPTSIFELFSNDKSRYDVDDTGAPKFDTAFKIWTDSQVAIAQAKKPDCWVVDKTHGKLDSRFSTTLKSHFTPTV